VQVILTRDGYVWIDKYIFHEIHGAESFFRR